MLLGGREAGCVREVAALYSDHYREVPLYEELSLCPANGCMRPACAIIHTLYVNQSQIPTEAITVCPPPTDQHHHRQLPPLNMPLHVQMTYLNFFLVLRLSAFNFYKAVA